MNELQDLSVDRVSLVDRAAVRDPQHKSEPRTFLMYKAEGFNPERNDHMELTQDQMVAAVEKAQQDRDDAVKKTEELEAALAKAKATSPGEGGDQSDTTEDKKPAINKAELAPEVREALEKAEADTVKAEERIAKAEKDATEAGEIAKAERDQRVGREFVVKAEGFKALPINPSDFGPVLKSVSEKLTKEESEALDTVLKAADEQIAAGELFKEMGRSGGTGTGDDNALSQAQRKAEELRKSDSSLTPEAALEKAMSDPEIQRQYLAENR